MRGRLLVGAPQGQEDDPEARGAFLLERYRGWPYHITEAIAATRPGAILRNDLYDRPPLERWSRGRVTLLGDAAHLTTPNLGQGACMAIEDAMVLARMLVQHRAHEQAFAAYEAERQARTARIVRLSRWFGQVGQWSRPLAVRASSWCAPRPGPCSSACCASKSAMTPGISTGRLDRPPGQLRP